MYKQHLAFIVLFCTLFSAAVIGIFLKPDLIGFVVFSLTSTAVWLAVARLIMPEYRCHECGRPIFGKAGEWGKHVTMRCRQCGADLRDVRFRSYRQFQNND